MNHLTLKIPSTLYLGQNQKLYYYKDLKDRVTRFNGRKIALHDF